MNAAVPHIPIILKELTSNFLCGIFLYISHSKTPQKKAAYPLPE